MFLPQNRGHLRAARRKTRSSNSSLRRGVAVAHRQKNGSAHSNRAKSCGSKLFQSLFTLTTGIISAGAIASPNQNSLQDSNVMLPLGAATRFTLQALSSMAKNGETGLWAPRCPQA